MQHEELFGTDAALDELVQRRQERRHRAKNKVRAGWKVALAVFVVCGLGSTVVIAFVKISSGRALARELELAKRDGIPLTGRDYVTAPVPDSENAAPLYKKAIALLAKKPFPYSGVRYLAGRSTRSDVAEIEAWSPIWAKATKIVDLAVTRLKCDFHIDWDHNIYSGNDYSGLRDLGRLECVVALRESNPVAIIEHLSAAQRISCDIGSDPTLIAYFTDISLRSTVLNTAGRIAKNHGRDGTVLRALLKFSESLQPVPSLKSHSLLEIAYGRHLLRDMSKEGWDPGTQFGTDETTLRLLRIGWLADSFEANFVRYSRLYYEKLPVDGEDWKAQDKQSQEILRAAEMDRSLSATFTHMTGVGIGGSSAGVSRYLARKNLTRTTLELLLSRLTEGAFPKVLPKAAYTVDPFTDKPLIYKPGKNGFILYSVDRDGVDNGGTITNMVGQNDIVITYP